MWEGQLNMGSAVEIVDVPDKTGQIWEQATSVRRREVEKQVAQDGPDFRAKELCCRLFVKLQVSNTLCVLEESDAIEACVVPNEVLSVQSVH